MTTEPVTPTLRLERLGPTALVEAVTYLDADPVANVFHHALLLRDALSHPRTEFWGARRGDDLRGLLFLGLDSGLVAPVADDHAAADVLASCARSRAGLLPVRRHLVGKRDVLLRFERIFRPGLAPPRLERDQLYLVLRRRPPSQPRLPELRAAVPSDEEWLYESGVALRIEELEEDPRRADEPAYRRHVETECRDGTTWVWHDAGGLRFRATVGALGPNVAQISGVYTPPGLRGRGIATRALAELCQRLFERVDQLCLFVNEHNLAALALYRRLGFTLHAPWRSVFWGGTTTGAD
jgi:ribosomal protein S18 acetylase RimI-like enzyme